MDDAGGVGGAESIRHLAGVLDGLWYGQAFFGHQFEQGFAGHEFHHHVLGFAVVNDVVNGDDVGVVKRGSGLGFLDEAAAALRIAGHAGGQHLHGDEAVETGVAGFIHLAHAAGAEFFEELILQNVRSTMSLLRRTDGRRQCSAGEAPASVWRLVRVVGQPLLDAPFMLMVTGMAPRAARSAGALHPPDRDLQRSGSIRRRRREP